MNYAHRVVATNTGTIPISGDGRIDVQNFNSVTDVVVDVLGYYVPAETDPLPEGASVYVPVSPCRLVDTRAPGAGGRLDILEQRQWQISGSTGFGGQGGRSDCGVPAAATAVEAAVSAVDPISDGYLRLWPAGEAAPNATFVNYSSDAATNTGSIPLAADGRIDVQNRDSTAHIVVDVQGYFVLADTDPLPAGASVYVPASPCRVVDTRAAGNAGRLGPLVNRQWQVSGSTGFGDQGGRSDCGVPATATAVEAAVSAVDTYFDGYIRLWPADEPAPNATFLNYSSFRSTTNTGTISLSPSGDVLARTFTASRGRTDVVVDIQGSFVPVATPLAGADSE